MRLPTLAVPTFSLSDSGAAIRWSIYLLGKLALVVAILLAFKTAVVWEGYSSLKLPSALTTSGEEQAASGRNKQELPAYNIIVERNIFGQQEKGSVTTAVAPATQLKLKLIGVNLTSGSTPIAIIEDSDKRVQDVFQLNEEVFKQAKLVDVQRTFVKLERNGVEETLNLVEENTLKPGKIDSGATDSEQTSFVLAENEVAEALTNLPLLLSQARAVPYFEGGQSVGMRLFAIRQGSLYEKVGLKNGDIVKEVNGSALTDISQGMKLFQDLRDQRSVTAKVVRNGTEKELSLSIQ